MILEGNRDRLGTYVREVADLMGLRDWTFELPPYPPEPTDHEGHRALASTEVAYGRRVATICIADDWAEWRPSKLRSTVVHELLHCHFAVVQWQTDLIEQHLSRAEWAIYANGARTAMELHVDAVAMAWAETLPAPEESAEEAA